MKTYPDVLNSMNADLKEVEVDNLENNFINTSDIIHYINAYHKKERVKDKYFTFLTYCLQQNIDLDKESSN